MEKAVSQLGLPFSFSGWISSSKSLMNRALIIQGFFPKLLIHGESECDDVYLMKKALSAFQQGASDFDCGDAGTVLRFLAFYLSRHSGLFLLKGSERLFSRPQLELKEVLGQLGVKAQFTHNQLMVISQGWRWNSDQAIRIPSKNSSQFASGLALSSWNLPQALQIDLIDQPTHDSYWQMTHDLLEGCGLKIETSKSHLYMIPQGQLIKKDQIVVEPDMSSAFAVAAMAALAGSCSIEFPFEKSIQPDFAGIKILQKMGVNATHEQGLIQVRSTRKLLPISENISSCPDLFPVLAILCAFAEGESVLTGLYRLAYKESHRVNKVCELLTKMEIPTEIESNSIKIFGKGMGIQAREFSFDPDRDHRMAMAAGLLLRLGWKVGIQSPEVINKSFPEFWSILGVEI